MALEIGDNLYLGVLDERNLTVYKEVVKKDKNTGEEVVTKDYLGYYPNLEYALKDILKQKLMQTELENGMANVLKEIEYHNKLAKVIGKKSWRIYEEQRIRRLSTT